MRVHSGRHVSKHPQLTVRETVDKRCLFHSFPTVMGLAAG